MITRFIEKEHAYSLLEYAKSNKYTELYITKDNIRKSVNNFKELKSLIKQSSYSIVKEHAGEVEGVLLVWKAEGNGVTRYYVKMDAQNRKVAEDLLTVLNWNFRKEIFVKLKRESTLAEAFKSKGFRFFHDRGREILYRRAKDERPVYTRNKDSDIN